MLAQESTKLDLKAVFAASPLIYTVMIALSLFSFVIWLYSFMTLRIPTMMPNFFLRQIREDLQQKNYEKAYSCCQAESHYTASILASAIASRNHGHQVMVEAMQTEGKRCGVALWQRLSLLNDVAIVAPMLGLLGTVVGLFTAFYDVNRSADTLASIFDGLGIAVGTTVAGLIVAIFATVFYATLKFRVVHILNTIENETLSLGNLIEAS
ncbi:MAG: Tol-Pal system protein TolQ [Chlamydiales bacterium]|nr:Tol-Pal system protein TolQ [Chlamydiales bacterium]MCH9636032.1 Tol-Pal system protein TolQ [Chlamydiales bacterium]